VRRKRVKIIADVVPKGGSQTDAKRYAFGHAAGENPRSATEKKKVRPVREPEGATHEEHGKGKKECSSNEEKKTVSGGGETMEEKRDAKAREKRKSSRGTSPKEIVGGEKG